MLSISWITNSVHYEQVLFFLFFLFLSLHSVLTKVVNVCFVSRSWRKKDMVPLQLRFWLGSSFTTLRTITSSTWRRYLKATVASKAPGFPVPSAPERMNCEPRVVREGKYSARRICFKALISLFAVHASNLFSFSYKWTVSTMHLSVFVR